MGKAAEVELGVLDPGIGGAGAGISCPCAAGIRRAFTLRCAVVLVLSACAFLSALFWLSPFRDLRSGYVSDDPDALSAEIQASFVLQKPPSFLFAYARRLEYDIYVEIGVPHSKVSVISMHSLPEANSTYVVFGVLPDPKGASISSPALSVLRSSLIELVLQQLNLSLTPSLFGSPTSLELLRFPGGITVIPPQSASIWERTQVLFNFTLNNAIYEIRQNLDELKNQLKFGLNLRSNENVYVELTNENGSTVAPQVTVQASVLSNVGSGSLLPYRLKQLADVITGPDTKNLGLNHTVFGKVKSVQLSSYLQFSISSLAPSPSPSPSPLPSPLASPSSLPSEVGPPPTNSIYLNPTMPPQASLPLNRQPYHSPCFHCNAPGPSMTPPSSRPCLSPLHPRSNFPSTYSPPPASSPDHLGPTAKLPPQTSPVRATTYTKTNPEERGGSSPSIAPSISPSQYSHSTTSRFMELWLIGLLAMLIFHY